MSLRRRIAGAAALAAAVVALAVGGIGYASTRSGLLHNVQVQLRQRASGYLQPHNGHGPGGHPHDGNAGESRLFGGGGGHSGSGPDGTNGTAPTLPPAPALGGAPGYFQFVEPNGTVRVPDGGTPQLPVNGDVLRIARTARSSFYTNTTVRGIHLEVLTIGDPYDHYAVQVALPLTSVDSVLHNLLLTYALLVGGGILLALLLGVAISRSALSPIERFLRRTEAVASELDRPSRLEETGAQELRRLAASFNRTLDALERSIQAQRHLVADASHELRTPIAALRSNIQIFLEADRLPEAEREGLQESIIAELDELTQLVSDVVELARGSAPSQRAEAIELDGVVRDAVERTRRRAPGLHFELDLEPVEMQGVIERVSRAVTNVIDNARKWSPAGGVIEVSLRGRTLRVRDHGPGFSERDLPYVFDRFYRADAARRLPGSGLGLAIVRQAAESHGGSVRAENADGGGALVTVSFGPAGAGGAAAMRAQGRPATGGRTAPDGVAAG